MFTQRAFEENERTKNGIADMEAYTQSQSLHEHVKTPMKCIANILYLRPIKLSVGTTQSAHA